MCEHLKHTSGGPQGLSPRQRSWLGRGTGAAGPEAARRAPSGKGLEQSPPRPWVGARAGPLPRPRGGAVGRHEACYGAIAPNAYEVRPFSRHCGVPTPLGKPVCREVPGATLTPRGGAGHQPRNAGALRRLSLGPGTSPSVPRWASAFICSPTGKLRPRETERLAEGPSKAAEPCNRGLHRVWHPGSQRQSPHFPGGHVTCRRVSWGLAVTPGSLPCL